MRISDWSSDVCSSDLSYREAGGALYPSVEGSSSATRSRNGSDHGGSDVSGHFQTGFDATWELDLFGANRRRLEAARYGMDAAEEELRATLLTLVGYVADRKSQRLNSSP